jgi:hypothetical protein
MLAIYDDDIMNLQILTRYPRVFHFAFDDDIEELVVIFWRWPAFEYLTDFVDIKHFLILECCTIWRYRKYFSNWWCDDIQHSLTILWWYRQLILLWRYPVIQDFYVFDAISRIFRFISLPPIYLDFVHFRPSFLIIRLMSFPPPIFPIWANSA